MNPFMADGAAADGVELRFRGEVVDVVKSDGLEISACWTIKEKGRPLHHDY
jgi:hypothetical protein